MTDAEKLSASWWKAFRDKLVYKADDGMWVGIPRHQDGDLTRPEALGGLLEDLQEQTVMLKWDRPSQEWRCFVGDTATIGAIAPTPNLAVLRAGLKAKGVEID